MSKIKNSIFVPLGALIFCSALHFCPADGGTCAANILFVLDASSSVRSDFENQIKFLTTLVDKLPAPNKQFQMGLISYSGEYTKLEVHDWKELQSKDTFKQFLKALKNKGTTTDTGKALRKAVEMVKTAKESPLIVSVTDAYPNSIKEVRAAMAQLKRLKVPAVAVGVNRFVNKPELIEMANPEDYAVITTNTNEAASEVSDLITRSLCIDPKPMPKPTRPPRVTTTVAPDAKAACPAYVTFLLDSSSSISGNFLDEKNYIAQIARELDFGHVREMGHTVALVSYSGKYRKIHERTSFDLSEFMRELYLNRHHGGTTYTNRAIDYATDMFHHRADPGKIPTILVTVTDGRSTEGVAKSVQRLRTTYGDTITTYAAGIHANSAQKELELLAGSKSRVFLGEDATPLVNVLKEILYNCAPHDKPKPSRIRSLPGPRKTVQKLRS